ncbi:MAG TPA: response regulator [Patescibacteria group bacterium]|nr:response regulator [Patescibacteria group bacterium]
MPVRLGRVLVVDDDPDTVDLLTTILSDVGYEVIAAFTGGDGLMMLEVESPDVILLDLQMPGLHGMDVLRRLRMARPEIPVIIVSGQGDAELARATLRRGAVDYIRKPMNPEHLVRAVAAALGGRAALRP